MGEVTQILSAIERGDRLATNQLLPLVYDELKRLAAGKVAKENPGLTLQTTALVHEAYIRLVGDDDAPQWESRVHFFSSAAEAMRRILVDHARSNQRIKRGGQWQRLNLDAAAAQMRATDENILALDEALDQLAVEQPQKADLVKLRFFAGLSIEDVAQALDISTATAVRHWRYAKAWLADRLAEADTAGA